MTALDRYVRLEAVGQWRVPGASETKEVLVSFGEASLVLSDFEEAPLTHWALAGLRTLERTGTRVRYAPPGTLDEVLEIEDAEMNEAIAVVRGMVTAPAPRRRRISIWPVALLPLTLAIAVSLLVLTGHLRDRAAALMPPERAALIGGRLLEGMEPCTHPLGTRALRRVSTRVAGPMAVYVVRRGASVARLPGDILIVPEPVVAESASPEVLAGWLAEGAARPSDETVLAQHIQDLPHLGVMRFLLTGELAEGAEDKMRLRLEAPAPPPDVAAVSARLQEAGIAPGPFRQALGEPLPAQSGAAPLLDDQAWIALKSICLN
ncbi:MAG: hypothetical protein AAGI50_09060 [Pseudomonadota bacterium]